MLTTLGRRVRAAAVLTTVFVATGCGGDGVPEFTQLDELKTVEQIPVAERPDLPAFEGGTLTGGHVATGDYAGKVLVINVWGSWCAPCREEAPHLRRVSEETWDEGVRFLGINVRDNDAAALAFEREFGITYPSITTADSAPALLALGSWLPQGAVPSTMVVDRSGRVAARVVGKTDYTTLRELVRDTLREADS